MFGYEKLPIFEDIDRRVIYRTIKIASRRAKLYSKSSVWLKEMFLLAIFSGLIFTVALKIEELQLGLIIAWSILSRLVLKKEFDKFVLPLLPKALQDAQTFPEMVK
ncbi:hypothetical protein [Colwellia sp. TT2012]|uniref:hypothetical protein n=1 Tax=Colwellia sp. TT2012 TaxID=1720342 RepID=UPI00070C0F58|nr:hypothetical protein [Colwellia sp. TT2012]